MLEVNKSKRLIYFMEDYVKIKDLIYIDNLPTIDLHGMDRDYARLKVLEFINDNKKMGNEFICIVHGIGNGILKKEVDNTLKSCRDISDYRLFYNNNGCTIAKIYKI